MSVIAAGVVPPIAGGLDKSNVPPSVRLPLDVTVPDNEIPLTVPVPDTLVTVPCGFDAVVMAVTRPYVSTVTTGIKELEPVVPAVTIPLVRLTVGTADVPATVNVEDVIDVTVPCGFAAVVTLVTCPCALVVITGISVAEP